jgi:hypothetical protein
LLLGLYDCAMLGRNNQIARYIAAGVALLVIGIATAASGPASAAVGNGHSRAQKGGGHSSPSPLVYGSGKLLTTSTTYAIWWGPSSGFPSDARNGIETLLGGFGKSSYLATANQYMPLGATTSHFAVSLFDPSVPPSHAPTTSTIVNEVATVLTKNGLTPDPNAVYLVYTSNFPHANFCAWHAAGPIGSTTVQVGYLPNTTGVTGCDPGNLFPQANSYSQGTRSLADSTAHEFMESVTDPIPVTGWADKNGQEIGDKCNFVYSNTAPITLSNGSQWQIQEEWSNLAGQCVTGS